MAPFNCWYSSFCKKITASGILERSTESLIFGRCAQRSSGPGSCPKHSHPRPDNPRLVLIKLCISLRMESPHSSTTSCPSTPSPSWGTMLLCIYPASPIAHWICCSPVLSQGWIFFLHPPIRWLQTAERFPLSLPFLSLPFLFPSAKDMVRYPSSKHLGDALPDTWNSCRLKYHIKNESG